MIYFAIQCHNFQLRLCWQLSSILDQVDPPQIVIDIAHMPQNGRPTTEFVCAKFRNRGLRIRETVIEDEDLFAKRGLVRNCQIENAKVEGADWLFFADCDNTYSEDFFKLLHVELDKLGYDHPGVIYSREKWHTVAPETSRWTHLAYTNPVIRFAHRRALKIPRMQKSNKRVAAGCMQVISMKRIEEGGGYYVTPEECGDSHLFRRGQGAKSDKQFRRRMGGSKRIFLPAQVHLNHLRDKEEGRHLEGQR